MLRWGVIRTRREGRLVYRSLDGTSAACQRVDEMLGMSPIGKSKVREEVGA
jgi:hypothetical protein